MQLASAGALDRSATAEQKLVLALKVCTNHDYGYQYSVKCSDSSSNAIEINKEYGMGLVHSMCAWAPDPFSYTVCLQSVVEFSGQGADIEKCPKNASWDWETQKQNKRKNCILNALAKTIH